MSKILTIRVKWLLTIVLLCIIAGGILSRTVFKCSENTLFSTDTIYVYHNQYDTIIQEKPVPYKITEVKVINDTTYLYHPVDTLAILADYYRIREYDDVLKDDSTGYVRLTEKVSQNALFGRKLYFESRCKDRIITNEVIYNGFYYTGALQGNSKALGGSIGIMYQNKRGVLYGAGVGHLGINYLYINFAIPFK